MVWVYLNRRIFNVKTLITLMRAFSPRNASLSLAHARDLLSQPLWRCQKTFRTTNELEFIKATPKRLRQQVASLRATATRCAGVKRLHQRNQRFFPNTAAGSDKPNSTTTTPRDFNRTTTRKKIQARYKRRTLTRFADLSHPKTNLSNRDRGDMTKQGNLYL